MKLRLAGFCGKGKHLTHADCTVTGQYCNCKPTKQWPPGTNIGTIFNGNFNARAASKLWAELYSQGKLAGYPGYKK